MSLIRPFSARAIVQRDVRHDRQRGIGLMETILGLIVAAIMLAMLAQWLKSSSDDMRAKRNADSLQQFSQMASHYLDANREALMRVMNADSRAAGAVEAASFCVVNNDTVNPAFDPYLPLAAPGAHGPGTCAVDAQWLVTRNLLPAGFALTNPYGQRWVAIYRLVYADYDNDVMTADTTQFDVEMLVTATDGVPAPNNELGMTVQLMGGIGGMYPDGGAPVAGCAAGFICGPGGWRVNVTDFRVNY